MERDPAESWRLVQANGEFSKTYHFRVEEPKALVSRLLPLCCVNAKGLFEPEWRFYRNLSGTAGMIFQARLKVRRVFLFVFTKGEAL